MKCLDIETQNRLVGENIELIYLDARVQRLMRIMLEIKGLHLFYLLLNS